MGKSLESNVIYVTWQTCIKRPGDLPRQYKSLIKLEKDVETSLLRSILTRQVPLDI